MQALTSGPDVTVPHIFTPCDTPDWKDCDTPDLGMREGVQELPMVMLRFGMPACCSGGGTSTLHPVGLSRDSARTVRTALSASWFPVGAAPPSPCELALERLGSRGNALLRTIVLPGRVLLGILLQALRQVRGGYEGGEMHGEKRCQSHPLSAPKHGLYMCGESWKAQHA